MTELDDDIEHFNALSNEINDLIKDIEWRGPDVAAERAKVERGEQDAVTARVLGEVLQDKQVLLEQKLKEWERLKETIEKATGKTLEELAGPD